MRADVAAESVMGGESARRRGRVSVEADIGGPATGAHHKANAAHTDDLARGTQEESRCR